MPATIRIQSIKPTTWIIIGLIATIAVGAFLWPRAPKPTAEYKQEMKTLTAEQQMLQQNQQIILKTIDVQEKMIQLIADKDQALIDAYRNNQTRIGTIKQKLNETTNTIDRASDDDIRRYFTALPE